MKSYFCPSCGIKTEDNTTGDYLMLCPCCNFSVRFYPLAGPSKTEEDAIKVFEQTELTDYQRTGRANTGKWARKKKQ